MINKFVYYSTKLLDSFATLTTSHNFNRKTNSERIPAHYIDQ